MSFQVIVILPASGGVLAGRYENVIDGSVPWVWVPGITKCRPATVQSLPARKFRNPKGKYLCLLPVLFGAPQIPAGIGLFQWIPQE